ncbi:DNA-binding response OmpR family regulator [Bacilli bacterium PM5-3]|nr:DNA-binding response OmpR family regulator [Bacilli bacterium PM5-3]MDH6604329.1 DNA-binding response OmpR family regulator [Bacilli bacterium PM5-9]
MKKILFIDDDKKYSLIIKEVLEKNDFIVDLAHTSFDGIELAKSNIYDVYIIDLYLDQFQGTQVCEIIKIDNPDAIVIYVSNSTESNDELKCLRTGGADFVSKESSIEVFIERIRKALIEKNKLQSKKIIKSETENIEIDRIKGIVFKDNELVHLTSTEFRILILLLENKNEPVSRDEIIEDVWGIPYCEAEIEPRTIDTHVKNIKRKLKTKSIISVRGVGYRWYER